MFPVDVAINSLSEPDSQDVPLGTNRKVDASLHGADVMGSAFAFWLQFDLPEFQGWWNFVWGLLDAGGQIPEQLSPWQQSETCCVADFLPANLQPPSKPLPLTKTGRLTQSVSSFPSV